MKNFTAQMFKTASETRRLLHSSTLVHQSLAKGFTLLELIVAITLAGIVAGFGIPGLYGSYQRQQMLNTANEMIAAINQARAKAQANYQGSYAGSASCDVTHPSYIDAYTFAIDADNAGYTVDRNFKSDDGCVVPQSRPAPIIAKKIPSPITVAQTSGNGTFPISFKTTSGQSNIGTTTTWIDLISNGFLGNVHYYVCITQNNMYAQSTAC